MSHLIEVAFRGNRKEFFRWEDDAAPPLKVAIIVEADRGEDLGHVHSTGDLAEVRCKGCPHGCGTEAPSRRALRIASPDDAQRHKDLGDENESARRRAMERVKANGLVMKMTDAEWQWDRKKLTFFFTAERRVDFRALVRDLAAMFRTRIELKQIGVRDEAKRLSGIGRCGREYCSASWLPDLRPVNLAVAKDQKLSLNPSQISGACGRLMCCLRYEHEFYVQSRRRFPKEGRILRTSKGEEKVVACDIFHERVTLRTAEGDARVVPLAELREELEALGEAFAPDRVPEREAADDSTDDAVLADSDERATRARSRAPRRESRRPEPVEDRRQVDTRVPPREERRTEPTVIVTPVVEHLVIIDVSASAEIPVVPPVTDNAAAGDAEREPRRKRRRGRRGGRRLRAAEDRANEPGRSDQPDQPEEPEDPGADNGDDDESSED